MCFNQANKCLLILDWDWPSIMINYHVLGLEVPDYPKQSGIQRYGPGSLYMHGGMLSSLIGIICKNLLITFLLFLQQTVFSKLRINSLISCNFIPLIPPIYDINKGWRNLLRKISVNKLKKAFIKYEEQVWNLAFKNVCVEFIDSFGKWFAI